ncbi:response regulator [Paenibacillus sp. H1-7]|uniref:response regulator n=1 Tax=Paenibacillus sp. H1-7 TaxID=2282849 RepID=UPI001EF84461|nr:response regulator [Paenibacillus sp. H1-7]
MRTYTCLIVDDEDLMVQRLELFFQELSMTDTRFRLIGKAYSGRKGVEEALKLKPDIILSDIVMPQMDGISMIEQLKEQLPHTQYILLTAYSSFEYAQRAIRANIMEYIVKVPLKEEDVKRALHKAAGILDEIKQKDEKLHSLHKSVLENKHRVQKQFFNELIRGEIPSHRAAEMAERMEIYFFQSYYCCFIVEMNHYDSFRNEYSAVDQSILRYAITNVVEETVMNFGASLASDLYDNRFIGFLSWERSRSDMDMENACQTVGRQIVNHVHQYLNQSVSVAFGGANRGLESIRKAYMEAVGVCEDFYYHDEHTVKTSLHRFHYNNGFRTDFQRELRDFLAWLNREVSREEIDQRFKLLHRSAYENKIHHSFMADLLRDFYRDVTAKFKARSGVTQNAGEFPVKFLTFWEQLGFIRDFIYETLQDGSHAYRTEIIRAKRFIEQNLNQRLSLQAIAEHVNLAPSYFSSLFKKTMNEGVVDYINRRKIELSLELLKVRDYSLLELCDEVGIVNEGYFCKLFKQFTGITPKQYRKKLN